MNVNTINKANYRIAQLAPMDGQGEGGGVNAGQVQGGNPIPAEIQAAGQVAEGENQQENQQAFIVSLQNSIQETIRDLTHSLSQLLRYTNQIQTEQTAIQQAVRETVNNATRQGITDAKPNICPDVDPELLQQQITALHTVIENQPLPPVEDTIQLTQSQKDTLNQTISNLNKAQENSSQIYNTLSQLHLNNLELSNIKNQLQTHFNQMINEFVAALQLWKNRDFLSEIRIINDPLQNTQQSSITMMEKIENAILSYSLALNINNLKELIEDKTM